jgi:lipoprotein-anchoring transpeptidase ErfK/SrfK
MLVNAFAVCDNQLSRLGFEDMDLGKQRAAIANGRLWRIAMITAAGAVGTASGAEAAIWSSSDAGYSRPGPTVQQRRHSRRHAGKKIEVPEKESAKPQGPLIIAISIEKQKLKVYDANGFFAETPISTGMRGHPTPMGVFSIIQKHKLHHSNIYSGAPMPFMQRITWSGVAMHAGVLPGYPASHGCIRMPLAFATKIWNWTKMGARVVVTPGEISPSDFSHPLLAKQKVVPQPVAAIEPAAVTPSAAKSDKTANAEISLQPLMMDARADSTPLREQTHTADASGHPPAIKTPVTMSDADTGSAKASATAETKSEAEPASATSVVIATSEDKPAEAGASDGSEKKPDETVVAQVIGDAVKPEASASESLKADEPRVEAKEDEVKTDTAIADTTRSDMSKSDLSKSDLPKSDVPKNDLAQTSEKPDDQVKSATGTVADVKKDQTRLPETVKQIPSKPDPVTVAAPKRSGQIAVLVSRKDQKLYVRENFKPVFDVPVTIAPGDRPLGTHVFTAKVDKDDANLLHWSVVSLPAPSRDAERRDEDERASRRRKVAGVVEMKPMPAPDSPAEALDRLSIPADAMTRITEALSTGGSIVVSDQGINSGETGEGTDFIVSLR